MPIMFTPIQSYDVTRSLILQASQEGLSDLDVLRELNLVNSLKVNTKTFAMVTAYQISFKGLKVTSLP